METMTSMNFRRYVVDARCLLWYIENSPRLGAGARSAMAGRDNRLYLPVIALAEACWFIEHGRSTIPTVDDLLKDVDADPRMTVVPLDRAVLDIANSLASVGEMHDRQIVATALLRSRPDAPVAILTLDERIRRCGAAPFVW